MYRDMENKELIELENSLDYRDPDVIEEIMSRAEEIREGITERYLDSFSKTGALPDEVFSEAVSLLI